MNKRTVLMGASLLLLLTSMPAQAGLGDLLGPILDPPLGGGLGELVEQVVAPVTETVATVVAPVTELVTDTVEIATGAVIVPVIEVVGETIETTIGSVEETTEILIEETVGGESPPVETPPVETPPIVIVDEIGLPETRPAPLPAPIEADIRQLPIQPETSPQSLTSAPQVVTNDPVPAPTVVRALLTSLTPPAQVQIQSASVEADPFRQTSISVDSGWLFSLSNWLGAGISGLLDVLSIPMRLLEVLLRALTSSGAVLLAPASLLLSLAIGGRRRVLGNV